MSFALHAAHSRCTADQRTMGRQAPGHREPPLPPPARGAQSRKSSPCIDRVSRHCQHADTSTRRAAEPFAGTSERSPTYGANRCETNCPRGSVCTTLETLRAYAGQHGLLRRLHSEEINDSDPVSVRDTPASMLRPELWGSCRALRPKSHISIKRLGGRACPSPEPPVGITRGRHQRS